MSKILKLASFGALLTLSIPSLAQENLWPLENAEWWVERNLFTSIIVEVDDSTGIGTIANGFTTTQIYYALAADTIINGFTYATLVQTYESSFLSSDGEYSFDFPPVTIPEFRGGFRVDGPTVYFWDVITTQEYLLFDFELSLGEQIPNSYVTDVPEIQIVQIDVIELDGQDARVFHLEGPGIAGNTIVEGVGSLYGPIQNLAIGFDSSHRLVCHSRGGVPVYPFSEECASQVVTHTNDLEREDFAVYPNPTRGTLMINQNQLIDIKEVSLYNVLGARVAVFDQELDSRSIEMPAELQNGVYLLKVKMNYGGTAVERIVLER